MRIVIGMHSLEHFDGTGSNTVTIGDHLQRTGHDVHIYSSVDGVIGDAARALGLRVVTATRDLPTAVDAFLIQDGIVALELLEASPETPQIYIWHSELFDVQLPPQIPDVTKLIVTLYGNADRRIRSLAVKPQVLRLTQPVDIVRFTSLRPIGDEPRKLVAIGNYLSGERKALLVEACARAGIEFRQFGIFGESSTSAPEVEMNAADIVVGKGRVAIEGMACGRAVYVYDSFGTDGWITPASYPAIEATCFAGTATQRSVTVDELVEDLLRYDPGMGDANRDLVLRNHNAMTHTGELVAAIEKLLEQPGAAPPNDAAFELARMARLNWRHEAAAYQLGVNVQRMTRDQEARLGNLTTANAELAAELAESRLELDRLNRSARWRAVNRLLRPFDRLRSLR